MAWRNSFNAYALLRGRYLYRARRLASGKETWRGRALPGCENKMRARPAICHIGWPPFRFYSGVSRRASKRDRACMGAAWGRICDLRAYVLAAMMRARRRETLMKERRHRRRPPFRRRRSVLDSSCVVAATAAAVVMRRRGGVA